MIAKKRKHVLRWLLLAALLCSVIAAGFLLWKGSNTPTVPSSAVSATTTAAPAVRQAPTVAKKATSSSSPTKDVNALVINAVHSVLPVPPQSFDCSKAKDPQACLQHQQPATNETKQAEPASVNSQTQKTKKTPSQPPKAAAPTAVAPAPAASSAKPVSNSKQSVASALNAKQQAANTSSDTTSTTSPVPASSPTAAQQAAAEKACQKAPNPDECLRRLAIQQGTPVNFDLTNYPLTSDLLGLSGPVSFMLRYDQELGAILGADYLQMFNESFGVSGKFTLGGKERRANITTGFAMSPDQQVKFTYEYLAQNLNFDFASGAVQEWVDQHAIGGAYQYLLRHEILHSFEISGYTVRANSNDLSSVAFNETDFSTNSSAYDVNYRRIAGGTENTLQAALNLLPLKDTALTVGAGYSSLTYDTQYEASPSNSGLAYKVEMTHILTPKTKLTGGVNAVASGREHNVGISHILPQGVEVAIKGQYIAGEAGLPDSKNVALNFTYPAPQQYTLGGFASGLQELRNWIEKPVVYKTRVLAIKDEMVRSYDFSADDLGEQTIYLNLANRTITPVSTVGKFFIQDPALQVTFVATITCPATDPSCSLNSLHLQLDTSVPNQATLISTANVDTSNPVTASGNPYVITITGTGTRAGLSQPLVVSSNFRLNVLDDAPTWPAITGTLQFDTTPAIQLVVAASNTAGGIALSLNGVPSGQTPTFSLDPAFNSTQAYWTVEQDGSGNSYLMRNVDSSGSLSAADIGNTVTVHLCGFVDGSQCIKSGANVTATVTADTATSGSGGFSVIGADIPNPFSTTSGNTSFQWDAIIANGLASFYNLPNNPTIPIKDDSFSNWANAQIIAWAAPASIAINSTGTMTGTAPIVSATTNYDGTFEVKTKSAGGSGGSTVRSTFKATVDAAPTPIVNDISGTIRFDLTNGTQDGATGGLTPQSSDALIDLTTMVSNSPSPIPVENLKFSFDSAGNVTQQGNWQIIVASSSTAGMTAGHSYLFRLLKSNGHLEAGDVNTTPNVTVCVANIDSPAAADCSHKVQATVAPDTLVNGSQQYVRIQIPEYVAGTASFATDSNTAIPDSKGAAYWNVTSKLQSVFLGQALTPSTALLIDNDVRTVANNSLTKDGAWGAPTYQIDGSGALTGLAPTISTTTNYDSYFTGNSKAAGANVPQIHFITAVFPSGTDIPIFSPVDSNIRFDMTNGSEDSGNGLKPANSAEAIDITGMVDNANTIGAANLQVCFNDPATCLTSVGLWQLYVANGSEGWGSIANHTYLFRNLNGSSHLEAGDINTTVPLLLYVNNIAVTPNAPVSATINMTVKGDNVNTIKGNVATIYTATAGSITFQWNTVDQIASQYFGASVSALLDIDNDSFTNWVAGAITNSMTPAWTSPAVLNMSVSGLMTGKASAIAGNYTGLFQVASKAANARNINTSFSATIQASGSIFTSCTDASDNCQMKFDTVDITTEPSTTDARDLTALVNSAYGYTTPTFSITSSSPNWRIVQDNNSSSATYQHWFLIRDNSGGEINANDVGSVVGITILVTDSGPNGSQPGTLQIKVNPDPALIYSYQGTSSFNIRAISDPLTPNAYQNDSQPGTLNLTANTYTYSPPPTANATSLACAIDSAEGVSVGCSIIHDSAYAFSNFPSFATESGGIVTFKYGTLTAADWPKPIPTDSPDYFAPKASTTANGGTATTIQTPPQIRVYDLEIVPRKSTGSLTSGFDPSQYCRFDSSNTIPSTVNECIMKNTAAGTSSNWLASTFLSVDVTNATSKAASNFQIIQYNPTAPGGSSVSYCNGFVSAQDSTQDINAGANQRCASSGGGAAAPLTVSTSSPFSLPSNGAPTLYTGARYPQAQGKYWLTMRVGYTVTSSFAFSFYSQFANYPDFIKGPTHDTNLVVRYVP